MRHPSRCSALSARLIHRPYAPAICSLLLLVLGVMPAVADIRAAYFRKSFVQWGFTPEKVRYDQISHLFFFGPAMGANGHIDASSTDPVLMDLRSRCQQRDVKLIGVIYSHTDSFTTALANPQARARAVQQIAAWCREARLDGIDIDYEHPRNATDVNNLGIFFADLRAALGDRPVLCAAVAPVLGTSSVPPGVVNEELDWLNIMSYDHNGEHATYNGSVYDMDFHRSKGILPSKLVLGVPFYGVHVNNRNAVGYSALINRSSAQPYDPDNNTVDGYYFNGRNLIRQKGKLGFEKGGGVFTWVIDQDTTDSRSLLTAMGDGADAGQATLEGFEAPLFGNPGDGTTLKGITLSPTLRRSMGGFGTRATLSFSGSPWNEVAMTSPALPEFDMPADSAIRFDAFIEGTPPGAVYFYLTDKHGRNAWADNYALSGPGWKSVWIPRSSFQVSGGGFDFSSVVRWQLIIQGDNGGTSVAPFTRTVVLDNLALYSPGGKRPLRLDADADGDGVPDRNTDNRSVVWIDRFAHPPATRPLDVYSTHGPVQWSWSDSANDIANQTLDGAFSFNGSPYEIVWLNSPAQAPFATDDDTVLHLELDVLEAMPRSSLVIDVLDESGAWRRFWQYNALKTSGHKIFNLRLGSPSEGTNDLSRITRWRIGFEGTNTATDPFTGRVQLARLAWGGLPSGSAVRSFEGDSDGDGLSDAAEDRNLNGQLDPGESSPARVDTDGDGFDDAEEATAGTRPDLSTSFPIMEPLLIDGERVLQWTAVAGRQYRIQSSTDLDDWTEESDWLTPEAGIAEWPVPGTEPRFFRLQIRR